jgi:hypothetical protein
MRGQAATALVAVACAAALGGCGGGGNLPTSLPSSLPSLPTTSTQPATTATSTETTPASTETTTATVTTAAPGSTSAPNPHSDPPWGWILGVAALLLIVVLIAGWALGRRVASRKGWRAQALQANADGTALHDAALAELIAATAANRPDRWSAIAGAVDQLQASLQRLETSPPDDDAGRAVQAALGALGPVRSAVAIGASAPAGTPLDADAVRTLRERLEELAASLRALRTYAGTG